MRQKAIIIGGGGHARVVHDALISCGQSVHGVTELDMNKDSKLLSSVPLIGSDDQILEFDPEEVLLANGIGGSSRVKSRWQVFEIFTTEGYSFLTVVHPTAVVSSSVELSEGVQVMAGAVVQAGAQIGPNSLINTATSVDHDCLIARNCHVAPGATICGGVRVGQDTMIGAGAVIIDGVSVGADCLIGAGSVVVEDIPEGTCAKGVPAKW